MFQRVSEATLFKHSKLSTAMKCVLLSLTFVLCSLLVHAQCPNDNAPTTPVTNYDASGLSVGVTQTMTSTAWGGEYATVLNAEVGATYTIDLCGSTSGDTYLTIYDQSDGSVIGFNDNTCGDDGSYQFVAPTGGPYRALCDIGAGCGTSAANHIIRITLDAPSSLPVELMDFDAQIENGVVVLRWETASELNNEGFEIMHSLNAQSWVSVGFVEGAGNSSTELGYEFEHREFQKGIHYYKLIQRDYDGTETPSKIRTVAITDDIAPYFQLFPNPSSGGEVAVHANIEIENLSVIDNFGRSMVVPYDYTTHVLNVADLPDGFYSVVIVGKNGEKRVARLSRN